MFSVFANTIKLISSLTNYFVMTIDQLREKIAQEKQQFQDYKAGKEAEINAINLQLSDKDSQIADLQAQLAAAGNIPDDLDVEGIVP